MNLSLSPALWLGASMLLCAFLQVGQCRISTTLYLSRFMALALAVAALWNGFIWHQDALYAASVWVLLVQAVLLPKILSVFCSRRQIMLVGKTIMPLFLCLAVGLLAVGVAMASLVSVHQPGLSISLAVVLLGAWLMMMRTRLIAQLIGFITLVQGLDFGVISAPGLGFIAFGAVVGLSGLVGWLLFFARGQEDGQDIPDSVTGARF